MHHWVIIGGGLHGVHIAARLIGDAGVPPERLRVVRVSVAEGREVMARYAVHRTPTLLGFRDGELVVRRVGAVSRTGFSALLDELLG